MRQSGLFLTVEPDDKAYAFIKDLVDNADEHATMIYITARTNDESRAIRWEVNFYRAKRWISMNHPITMIMCERQNC